MMATTMPADDGLLLALLGRLQRRGPFRRLLRGATFGARLPFFGLLGVLDHRFPFLIPLPPILMDGVPLTAGRI